MRLQIVCSVAAGCLAFAARLIGDPSVAISLGLITYHAASKYLLQTQCYYNLPSHVPSGAFINELPASHF
eukprot:scaffold549244_cov33-Prasinocladus_malaysianus.AAC.1